MIYSEICNGIHYVGVNDRTTTRFEGIWPLPYGVTYNSYIVKGNNATALIDGVEISHSQRLIDRIKSATPSATLDYMIINHMEPFRIRADIAQRFSSNENYRKRQNSRYAERLLPDYRQCYCCQRW